MWIPFLAGGVAGGALGAVGQIAGQAMANDSSKEIASKQRELEKIKHEREMAEAEKARKLQQGEAEKARIAIAEEQLEAGRARHIETMHAIYSLKAPKIDKGSITTCKLGFKQ